MTIPGPADVREHTVVLPACHFRVLEWPATDRSARPAVLLHGLTAVADVWGPTIDYLPGARPGCWAPDQRGHGESHPAGGGWSIGAYVRDVVELVAALGVAPVHLVGHSMGARVAIVVAARHPRIVRTVSIVDIGPEQWKDNWTSSVAAFDALPAGFANEQAALEFAGSRTMSSPVGTGMFLARLKADRAEGLTWRADREALKATVKSHRSRHFWREWEAIDVPALFVRGGTSYEVRPHIAQEMTRRNARVEFVEVDGVSHNIPMIAPERLASLIADFWARHP